MGIYRKKKDISKHLLQAFYLFGKHTDLEAIQFSYVLLMIKTLTAQLLNKSIKMLKADV